MYPRYGYQKLTHILKRKGTPLGKKKVYKILSSHHLLKKKTRDKNPDVERLKALRPTASNQVWQMDVTYVFIEGYGFYYLINVVDYWSRFLLSSYFTDSYRSSEIIRSLEYARAHAEKLCGFLTSPITLVTDNGPSFISRRFQEHLRLSTIVGSNDRLFRHMRIGYRMPTQLGLLERLHRTLKEEEVWPAQYRDPLEARVSLGKFVKEYNYERPHWALKLGVPAERYLNVPFKELTPCESLANDNSLMEPLFIKDVPLCDQTYFADSHSHNLGG